MEYFCTTGTQVVKIHKNNVKKKTKYLQHYIFSNLRIRHFTNSFNVSKGLG